MCSTCTTANYLTFRACASTYPEDINHKDNERVVFLGELDYMSLLSLYKRSSTFIHLAYLDHCPNVVVDAQAADCKIICSSTGGTKEIVSNGIIIHEKEWDFKPTKLYSPPAIDFSESFQKREEEKTLYYEDIINCGKKQS